MRWLIGRAEAPAGAGGRGVSIDPLRRRIDELDERLVELLNERASCALRIGEIKQRLGSRSTSRIASRRCWGTSASTACAIKGPLSPEALTRLFERIIDEARRLERESATHARARRDAGRRPPNRS